MVSSTDNDTNPIEVEVTRVQRGEKSSYFLLVVRAANSVNVQRVYLLVVEALMVQ